MRPKVSVIIPVYNQERYLPRSLDCIARQNLTNYEVLLINDGSTDSSLTICTEYCAKYDFFRLINKTNGGVASARQTGLDNCKGEYVIHMDPDDYVESDFLGQLYKEAVATNADMVICDYYEVFKDKTVIFNHDFIRSSSPQELLLSIAEGTVWGVCWNKLIKTECIQGKVNFEPGINFHEDKLFITRVLHRMGGGKISTYPALSLQSDKLFFDSCYEKVHEGVHKAGLESIRAYNQ